MKGDLHGIKKWETIAREWLRDSHWHTVKSPHDELFIVKV